MENTGLLAAGVGQVSTEETRARPKKHSRHDQPALWIPPRDGLNFRFPETR